MGNLAISVEHLGKHYRIGHAAKRPDKLRKKVCLFLDDSFRQQTLLFGGVSEELRMGLKRGLIEGMFT